MNKRGPKKTYWTFSIWTKTTPRRFWLKAWTFTEPPKGYTLLTRIEARTKKEAITLIYSKAHLPTTAIDLKSYQLILQANDNPATREELKHSCIGWNSQEAMQIISKALHEIDPETLTKHAVEEAVSQIKKIFTRDKQAIHIKNKDYFHKCYLDNPKIEDNDEDY